MGADRRNRPVVRALEGLRAGPEVVPTPQERARRTLRRAMRTLSNTELDEWLAVEPHEWALRHAPTLHAAGLTPKDAYDLHRRLGDPVARDLSRMVDAGRMADITIRHIHLWAASGLLKPSEGARAYGAGASPMRYTRWVTEARRYITACEGNQSLAAAAAGAHLSVEETATLYSTGQLAMDSLLSMVALRETTSDMFGSQ